MRIAGHCLPRPPTASVDHHLQADPSGHGIVLPVSAGRWEPEGTQARLCRAWQCLTSLNALKSAGVGAQSPRCHIWSSSASSQHISAERVPRRISFCCPNESCSLQRHLAQFRGVYCKPPHFILLRAIDSKVLSDQEAS